MTTVCNYILSCVAKGRTISEDYAYGIENYEVVMACGRYGVLVCCYLPIGGGKRHLRELTEKCITRSAF
jgi:hypothetical protein